MTNLNMRRGAWGAAAVLCVTALTPALATTQDAGAATDCSIGNTFNLTFSGGSLDQYVAAIQNALPCANILLAGDGKIFPVAAVTLRNVTALGALRLIEGNATRTGGRRSNVTIQPTKGDAGVLEAIRVQIVDFQPQVNQSNALHAAVFSVAEPLAMGAKQEDILGALEAALGVFESEAGKIRFHAPTGLVMIRAPQEQLDIVEATVNMLSSAAHTFADRKESLSARMEELQVEMIEAQANARLADERVSTSQDAADLVKKRISAGEAKEEELQGYEMQVARARRDLQVAKSEVVFIQGKLERTHASLAALRRDDTDKR